MANMTANQRAQFERIDLSVPSTGVQTRGKRALAITTVLAAAIVGVLGYLAAGFLDSWSQVVVFGAIVLTAIGAMLALSPNRAW